MIRPLVQSENLQVRLPDGTKDQMRRYLPIGETLGSFWRDRMLEWLANMKTVDVTLRDRWADTEQHDKREGGND